ncbi:MAG: aldo/keto reductase [Chloroherpetonaceae bacterium]|nr:aldo/keto reductase [Chthonomonadaceae bacterium]MDW8206421.1 aldo/keto reductase [Chloroherpetonaceae bacterium]
MKTQTIGTSHLITTRLNYGCMGILGSWSDPDPELARPAVLAAYEAGFRLFDHADIYNRGRCEEAFGRILRDVPGMRDEIIIVTKCGIKFPGWGMAEGVNHYDFSAGHILQSVEGSLHRLGVETIDVLLLHRPDILMDPDEVAEAFSRLRAQGKVREFGVSNFTPAQVRALQSRLPFRLVIHQVEIHPGRIQCFQDGTLDQCLEERITPQAWSPVGRGLYATGGVIPEEVSDPEPQMHLLRTLDDIAHAHGVTRTAITLAWLMHHPSRIMPVIGTIRPERIREAATADSVTLSRQEWYTIYVAARGERMP